MNREGEMKTVDEIALIVGQREITLGEIRVVLRQALEDLKEACAKKAQRYSMNSFTAVEILE